MIELAVLLCAGAGTRLRPLTDDRPKALVPVGDETMLARAVRLLRQAGVREFVVATGYRAQAVKEALGHLGSSVTFCHNDQFASTQNAVSLLRCGEAVGGRAFFKLDGDVLFLPDVLLRLANEGAPLAVAVERRDDLGAEEMKVVTEGRRIAAFGKELDPARCAGESIGIELVGSAATRPLFEALRSAELQGRTQLYYEDIYGELIHDGLEVRMVDVTDLPWIEVDTPDDLERARAWVSSSGAARGA
jgi:choline kinase